MYVGVGFVVDRGPFEFQHLYLDSLGERIITELRPFAPHEYAGITPGFQVFPFYFQNKVFVLAVGAHHADGFPAADQDALLHLPGVFGGVHVHPAVEVFAVEERLERQRVEFRLGAEGQNM